MPSDNQLLKDTQLLLRELETLPSFVSDLLMIRAGERAIKTRLSYAIDYNIFFDYLIEEELIQSKEKQKIEAKELAPLTTLELDKYLKLYMATHANSSAARMKASLSVLFKYLTNVTKDLPENNFLNVQKVKVPKKDYVVFLTREEQEVLVNEIKHPSTLSPMQQKRIEETQLRDLAIIFLFLDTGLRLSEVQKANIKDVSIDECYINVERKGGNTKQVFFSDEATGYLNDYLQQRQRNPAMAIYSSSDDALFVNIHGERLTVRGIQKIVEKWVTLALPSRDDIGVHKLRSSFAMTFFEAEHDILALQERMNHKSLNTTNVYVKASENISEITRNWRQK